MPQVGDYRSSTGGEFNEVFDGEQWFPIVTSRSTNIDAATMTSATTGVPLGISFTNNGGFQVDPPSPPFLAGQGITISSSNSDYTIQADRTEIIALEQRVRYLEQLIGVNTNKSVEQVNGRNLNI